MIKYFCDICGKEMQNKMVVSDSDPLDYRYGECRIELDVGMNGVYDAGFTDICHECAKKIREIEVEDFRNAFKRLAGKGGDQMRDRLTKRKGGNVYLNSDVLPRSDCKGEFGFMFCQKANECENVKNRKCPVLKVLDRLAEYEDKAEQALKGGAQE